MSKSKCESRSAGRHKRDGAAVPVTFDKGHDGAEGRPDAIEPRVLAGRAERIEVMIAGATVRVPVGVDAVTLERVLAAVRSMR